MRRARWEVTKRSKELLFKPISGIRVSSLKELVGLLSNIRTLLYQGFIARRPCERRGFTSDCTTTCVVCTGKWILQFFPYPRSEGFCPLEKLELVSWICLAARNRISLEEIGTNVVNWFRIRLWSSPSWSWCQFVKVRVEPRGDWLIARSVGILSSSKERLGWVQSVSRFSVSIFRWRIECTSDVREYRRFPFRINSHSHRMLLMELDLAWKELKLSALICRVGVDNREVQDSARI
jgi:hypothetical protein